MPLKLYKRGKVWHYRGTVAGRLLRGSAKTASKEVAARIASNREQEAWKGHLDPSSVLTFAQAAMKYREVHGAVRFLAKVEDHWKDTPVRDITGGAIRASAVKLYPHCKPQTQNRQAIVPAQAVINHAADLGLCPPLIVTRFDEVQKKAKVPMTWAWVQDFMRAATHKPKLAALFCCMYLTASRISQAISIEWETGVDFKARKILIKATRKGDDDRWAHMPPELIAALANIPGERIGRVFGFFSRQNASTQAEAICEKAGLVWRSPHCGRHGFASVMLDKGESPVTVAKRGGWKDIKTMLNNYGHDLASENVTDVLTDTESAQPEQKRNAIK